MTAIGIGGVFLRARDPEALKSWYARHLAIESNPVWQTQAGPVVFAPFEADTDYWPADRQMMMNYRVADLDSLVEALQADGIEVERRPDEWDHPQVGRFARIHDPEGNPIELWQPA